MATEEVIKVKAGAMVRDREKAFLIMIRHFNKDLALWFPKSKVKYEVVPDDDPEFPTRHILTVPEWLWKTKETELNELINK